MDVPGGQELDGVEAAEDGEDNIVNVAEDQPAHQVCLAFSFSLLQIAAVSTEGALHSF